MAFTVGTLSASDVRVVHSRMTRITIIRRPSIKQICDRSHEAELQAANAVVVHQPDLSSAAMSDRGRDDAYDAATEVGASQVIFDIDIHGEVGNKIYYLDLVEVPWDVMAQVNEAQSAYEVQYCGDKIYTYLRGLTAKAITSPTEEITAAADLPKDDNTGDNNNAGKIAMLTYGSKSANFVSSAGAVSGDVARGYPLEFIRNISLRWKALSIIDGSYVGGMPRGDESMAWFHPVLIDVLRRDMEAKDLHFDTLTEGLLSGPSILAPDGRQWEGMLDKVHIMADASLTPPASDAASTFWDMFAITPVGLSWAERPLREMEWSAMEYQDEPCHVMRKIRDAGVQLTHNFLVVRGRISTVDDS